MTAITEAQSAAWFERRGLACGEDPDETRCWKCQDPTDPDDLADVDGLQHCPTCLIAEVGDELYAPEHSRDI